jgi:hypothetical protein
MSGVLMVLVLTVLAAALIGPLVRARRRSVGRGDVHRISCDVGLGTVRAAGDGDPLITVEVESLSGQRFIGTLHLRGQLRHAVHPGILVLVAFDPAAREELSLADDMLAVRAAFDQTLIRKGLITCEQLDLIHHGTRSRAVVTAMRTTGAGREDYREVELDLMVEKPGGGQFPAHETALIPMSSLERVSPGSVIDTYYRPGDESAVAVHVPPS